MMGGSLQKLQIQYEKLRENDFSSANKIVVLFNPQTLQYRNAVKWERTDISAQVANEDLHKFDFGSTQPEELTFELFFDISQEREEMMSGVSWLAGRLAGSAWESVTRQSFVERMNKLRQLSQVNRELHRPPCCKLFWGTRLLLQGVLTSLERRFTSFLPDGTPERATFSCSFTAIESESWKRRMELHSADVAKQRVVRQGDTLHGIAHEEYGDAALWRPIARENRILNPLQLVPGTRLIIPPLT